MVLSFVGYRLLFRTLRMTSDAMAPEINRGDHVIVLRGRWVSLDIQPGDVIAFRRHDHAWLRKVARVGAGSIWIVERSPEGRPFQTEIPRNQIIGKVVHKLTFAVGKRGQEPFLTPRTRPVGKAPPQHGATGKKGS